MSVEVSAASIDSATAARAACAAAQDKPFPQDIFTVPRLRWAVVGCGAIANQMAQTLALAGRRIQGVANRTHEKAVAFAETYGIPRVYASFDELWADPDIDAVYIATPHNTHITYLRAALAAGKHVLCEKAITLNAAELAEARPSRTPTASSSWMRPPSCICRSTMSCGAACWRARSARSTWRR